MNVYRISKTLYTEIDGTGGLIYPGRWHLKGNLIVYSSEHRSLAALEIIAHLSSGSWIESNFKITTIHIPDQIEVRIISHQELDPDWNHQLKISKTQVLGTQLLHENGFAVIRVPSALIRDEYNYLLNPKHKDYNQIKIIDSEVFSFDGRLVR